jgi:tetratricopeptide (TPR) repeat protein
MILLLALSLLQDAEALSAKALELAQERQTAQAEKLWKQALAIDPKLFSAAFNLGFLYYSQKQFAEAEPLLTVATKIQPKDFNAHYLLGVVRSQLGRTIDALRAWRNALALWPDHLKLLQIMAVEYGKGGYFREAARVAERALAIKDADSSTWLIAIKSYQDAGDHTAALRLATGMNARFPDHPRAAFEYGFELHRNGRREEAMPFLQKAMNAKPPWEEPYFFMGDVLLKENRAEDAIPLLRRAIELRPDYSAAAVALARALMALGRNEEAKTELLRAVKADPKHPQPHLVLAQLYFRLGDEAAAAREKEISARLRIENPRAVEGLQSRPFPDQKP